MRTSGFVDDVMFAHNRGQTKATQIRKVTVTFHFYAS